MSELALDMTSSLTLIPSTNCLMSCLSRSFSWVSRLPSTSIAVLSRRILLCRVKKVLSASHSGMGAVWAQGGGRSLELIFRWEPLEVLAILLLPAAVNPSELERQHLLALGHELAVQLRQPDNLLRQVELLRQIGDGLAAVEGELGQATVLGLADPC